MHWLHVVIIFEYTRLCKIYYWNEFHLFLFTLLKGDKQKIKIAPVDCILVLSDSTDLIHLLQNLFLIFNCILNREMLVNCTLDRHEISHWHTLRTCTELVEVQNVKLLHSDQLKHFTEVTETWTWSYQPVSSSAARALSDEALCAPAGTQHRPVYNGYSERLLECMWNGL